jgi:type II restriction enzyme
MDILSQLLTDNCKKIKDEKKWKSASKIVGEAIEDCITTIACPICNEKKALLKYKANEKSKDVKCEKCNSQIQIKATKQNKKNQKCLKLLGAEYKTTCSSIKENTVHYLIVLYTVVGSIYTINNIYFIDRIYINESCVIPRKPLSSTAKRAGWQGCTLIFNEFKSIKLL